MKRPATASGRRSAGEIKVTRNSKRPEIKASRGPGGPVKRRKVATPKRKESALSEADKRVAATRRQSIGAMGAQPARRPGTAGPAKSTSRRKAAPTPTSRRANPSTVGRNAGSTRGSAKPTRSAAKTSNVRPNPGGSRSAAVASGGGSVRAVAVSAGGGAAVGAARVMQEVARPVRAVTRPALKVVTGGIEAIPQAAGRATPMMRGRMAIVVVAILAAGLIAINVAKLRAGDGYAAYAGRSLELQRENTELMARNANLRASERIKRYAAKQGLVMPAPEQFTYLNHRSGDAERAARNLTAPVTTATPQTPGASAATGATTQSSTPTVVTPTVSTPTATTTPQTGAGL
jgi:hypothetical protein